MKVRTGFVSNSSSSSFIVGFKKGLSQYERQELVLKKMGVKEGDFFFNAATEVANCIAFAEPIETDSFAREYGYENWEEMFASPDESYLTNGIQNCLNKDLDVCYGSASNESYETGKNFFCDTEWKVDDDDFFIEKEAGF